MAGLLLFVDSLLIRCYLLVSGSVRVRVRVRARVTATCFLEFCMYCGFQQFIMTIITLPMIIVSRFVGVGYAPRVFGGGSEEGYATYLQCR